MASCPNISCLAVIMDEIELKDIIFCTSVKGGGGMEPRNTIDWNQMRKSSDVHKSGANCFKAAVHHF